MIPRRLHWQHTHNDDTEVPASPYLQKHQKSKEEKAATFFLSMFFQFSHVGKIKLSRFLRENCNIKELY
jgi:hypothetical protein